MAIPEFTALSRAYPDYWKYPQPEAVRKMIGGEANDPDITNTCTIRLSHAMNSAGVAIPAVWQKITNRKGKNKQFYIIRVANFRGWMEFRFGKPDLDFQKKAGDRFDRSSIQGFEGVIAFEIGFSDATGHFDLWYRDKFSHAETAGRDYFASASRISLWTTGTRMTEAPV
jgi:hypothetical protein